MIEAFAYGYTLPEAYHDALIELYMEGELCPCPDYSTSQKELSMTIQVENPLCEPMISRLFVGGPQELEQYRQEILDGILDFEIDRGNWDYTYHSRMKDQMQFIVGELRRNPDSRRAVIDIRDWKVDTQKQSPACLQNIQYFIRDNMLHCKVLFRSNDACKATFMNAFALIMLQERFAKELGVEVGTYVHRANSFHCYEKDFQTLKDYVKRIQKDDDIFFDYEGDWKEMMDEAKPIISKNVEALKKKGDDLRK